MLHCGREAIKTTAYFIIFVLSRMQNTLIIKTGAAGDIVRTTSILNILEGHITWVVDDQYQPIFPDNMKRLHCISAANSATHLLNAPDFDLVLSLEENLRCATLASSVKSEKTIGLYLDENKITYTDEAAGWYDMSLLAKKGNAIANELKKKNQLPFQYWLFKMIGKHFNNEPYVIYRNNLIQKKRGLIGIEKRAGHTWPNKEWSGYDELIRLIEKDGFAVKVFVQKNNIREYLDEIAGCSCIICGDTLAMHVAIAYHIPCISIFNCTPPAEIHGYGSLIKINSPLIEENFFSRSYSEVVVSSVPVSQVYDAFRNLSLAK
jgi:heptosyltransferase-2